MLSLHRLIPTSSRDRLVWAAVAVLVSLAVQMPALNQLDRLDLDALHFLRASLPAENTPVDPVVAIVAIDETTYRTPPFAGLPKVMWTQQMAMVQNAVLAGGAKAFAWDIILPTSATRYVADKRFDTPLLKSLAIWGRKKGRVILGDVSVGTDIVGPHRAFVLAAGGAKNVRSLNLALDSDGVARSLPGFAQVHGGDGNLRRVPAMAGELAARGLGAPVSQPPLNAALNFPENPAALPVYSFADLVACGDADYFTKQFHGKVVLFGAVLDIEDRKLASNRFATAPDFTAAPAGCKGGQPTRGRAGRNLVPGVTIHAAAVDNLIRRTFLVPTGIAGRVTFVLVLALFAAVLALRVKTSSSLVLTLVVGIIWGLIAAIAFRANLWLPLIDGWLALVLAWSASFLYRFSMVDRERATVRESFSRYLDEELIEDIIDRGEVPDLGGERREMTVFFSDIAAFSSLSEHMTPPELVKFLNIYFEIISKELQKHGGIIERFVGDSVVALFGAPITDDQHALNGLRCALAIEAALEAGQNRFGLPDGLRVGTRIGVNSGDMVVGNVGAEKRFTYTVMGDCVNLAARLESGGKQFGTTILVGEATHAFCGDEIVFRNVDKVRVVGRDKPVEIYEPLGNAGDVSAPVLELKRAYEHALSNIRDMAFGDARKELEALATAGDAVSVKTLERLAYLEDDPPSADWDRVMNLQSK